MQRGSVPPGSRWDSDDEPSLRPRGELSSAPAQPLQEEDLLHVKSSPDLLSPGSLESVAGLRSLRKPVEAVLLKPKDGRITVLARKLFNVMVARAQASPVAEDEYYRIDLDDIVRDTRYNSKNIEYLTTVLNELMSTVVNWGDSPKNLVEQEGGRGRKQFKWSGATLVAFARIESKEPKGYVLSYDFHRSMKSIFQDPVVYATISLEMNASMKSYPALVLYEIAVRYATNKDGLTAVMPWRQWIPVLTGSTDNQDTIEYKYFSRDTLKPALKFVNESQADYEIRPLIRKVRRVVETLQFQVIRKKTLARKELKPLDGLEVSELPLLGRMLQYKVSQAAGEAFLKKFGPARVNQALALLDDRVADKSQPPIRSVPAYLGVLLENGTSNEVIEVQPKEVPPSKILETARATETSLERIKKEYENALRAKTKEFLAGLSVEDREAQYARFEKEELPSLPDTVKRSWDIGRVPGGGRKVKGIAEYHLIDWLARAQKVQGLEAMLEWLDANGGVQLQSNLAARQGSRE